MVENELQDHSFRLRVGLSIIFEQLSTTGQSRFHTQPSTIACRPIQALVSQWCILEPHNDLPLFDTDLAMDFERLQAIARRRHAGHIS